MVRRTRKITMTMARPTATSATVMAIVNTTNSSPTGSACSHANAARLMFTAFSISSMPRRMPTALRRVRTPNNPITNTRAATTRYAKIEGILVLAGEVDRTEQRCDEQHAQELEGHRVGTEQPLRE